MKTGKLIILIIALAASGITAAHAQSRKEKIELLTKKVDSLEKAVSAKSESLQQLQVKLARMEGAADVHTEEIKRLENKSDSLRSALIGKTMAVDAQAAKITELSAQITELQAQGKDLASKNDALTAELKTFKSKPEDTNTTGKDNKLAELPKEAAKQ
jgi:chromosome segregation ATPase